MTLRSRTMAPPRALQNSPLQNSALQNNALQKEQQTDHDNRSPRDARLPANWPVDIQPSDRGRATRASNGKSPLTHPLTAFPRPAAPARRPPDRPGAPP